MSFLNRKPPPPPFRRSGRGTASDAIKELQQMNFMYAPCHSPFICHSAVHCSLTCQRSSPAFTSCCCLGRYPNPPPPTPPPPPAPDSARTAKDITFCQAVRPSDNKTQILEVPRSFTAVVEPTEEDLAWARALCCVYASARAGRAARSRACNRAIVRVAHRL